MTWRCRIPTWTQGVEPRYTRSGLGHRRLGSANSLIVASRATADLECGADGPAHDPPAEVVKHEIVAHAALEEGLA
jgi:hypothetical protein